MKTPQNRRIQGVHGDVQERAVGQEPIRTEDILSPELDGPLRVITNVRSQRADRRRALVGG